MTNNRNSIRASMRRHERAGLAVILFVVGGIGSWAAATTISGAVIAPGTLVVETHVKKVQHPTGGIVGEIFARDGDLVEADAVLIRLDDTIAKSSLAIITKRLHEMLARKARLEAERNGEQTIVFPDDLTAQSQNPEVAAVISAEQRLLDVRRTSREGQEAQLRQRIEQLKQEISGLKAQAEAKGKEIEFINRELEGARLLWSQNLMPITKLTAIEREATRVSGEKAKLTSDMARAGAQIAETELEIIQIDKNLESDVARELGEIDAKIGEFVERKVAAEADLRRIDIRAPQAGIVHQSIAHTIGGVINSGEVIMLIVPKSDDLTVEAKIAPADIDQVHVGQEANLRFSAFNQRTTPEISGKVKRRSADISRDQTSGATYYTVYVSMSPDEVERLGEVSLVPGMPVEVFIETGDRRVISYLVKPLADQIARAFRER